MNMQENLIDLLEGVLASKDLSRRAEVLRRVTDLFIHGSGKFSDEQIELFDDVMGKLIVNIELAARVAFGDRIARVADAPGRVIRTLAFDDAIEVAAPVLAHSPGSMPQPWRRTRGSRVRATCWRSPDEARWPRA